MQKYFESFIKSCWDNRTSGSTIIKSSSTTVLFWRLSIRGSDFTCPMMSKKDKWDSSSPRNRNFDRSISKRIGECKPIFLEPCKRGQFLILGGDGDGCKKNIKHYLNAMKKQSTSNMFTILRMQEDRFGVYGYRDS